MSRHHPPCPPSLSWGCTKRRSGLGHRSPGKQGRVRDHGSRGINAGMLDVNHVVAALPQAPQDESGPEFGRLDFVVDDTGLASGEAVAHRSGLHQKIKTLEANARSSRGVGKPNSSTLRLSFRLAKRKLPKKLLGPIAISSQVPEKYSCRPPHPLDVGGKVSHVNICPVCEKYTVTELDRSAALGTGGMTTLRARFNCGLCREVLDLGIAQFDPRGIPGVTMYRNEDRFRPPVPPRGKYPCPRCWKNTHTSFQCMVAYLREESKVPCEPACPAERLDVMSSCDWGKPEEKEKEKIMEARNVIRTVLGLL